MFGKKADSAHGDTAWFRFTKSLARCQSGTSMVEFALVLAPFLALLAAILQTALVFFAGRLLDETVEQASRAILTGQAQAQGLTQTGFANLVCANTFALFTCGNFMINVQNYSSFSSASTATPTLTFNAQGQVTNNWSYNAGNPNDIVVIQVMYQWPMILGPLGFDMANLSNGNRLLISTAVFKNEPY